MINVKLNDKMNITVKEMLQLRNDPISIYALKRIEYLESFENETNKNSNIKEKKPESLESFPGFTSKI